MLERETAPQRPASTATRFGRAEYYIAILGKPSVSDPWMIQFGGHHLAINVTVAGPADGLTPNHTRSPPPKYTVYGPTIRPLGHGKDKTLSFLKALNPAEPKQTERAFVRGG